MVLNIDLVIEINNYANELHPQKQINYKEFLILVNNVYSKFIKNNSNIKLDLINIILLRIYKVNIKIYNNDNIFDFKCLRNYNNLFDNVKIPPKYKNIYDQFNKLLSIPQPEQRTQEWFDYRKKRITASDTAAAIDLNPYEPVETFILKKCDPTYKFLDNQNVYHGKKYEPIATLLYEHIYNIQVTEFGALPSEKYPLLGASPDGICSYKTLDNKFSKMLGRMLEIKCTVLRKINTSGKIIGNICPFYYYCQVQQQLECCDLDLCDFWQCKIIEYTRNSYLNDSNELLNKTKHSIGIKNDKIEINNLYKKGLILKFLPKIFIPEFDQDNIEWKSKFLYPSRLDMNEFEYDNWVINTLDNWMIKYKELAKTHYYEKIIYWKVEETHNVTINRDKLFLSNILPILNETWKRVIYYRNNLDKLYELKDIIEKRTKYQKIDTTIKISNNFVNKKILFLENNIKNNNNNNNNNNCEFID